MAYDIIPFLIIIICFLIIIIILGRKFPDLRVIDVETIPEEREQRVKKQILAGRLKRDFLWLKRMSLILLRPILGKFLQLLQRIYTAVIEMEKHYKQEKGMRKAESLDPQQKIQQYIDQAQEHMRAGRWDEAEEAYIQAIAIDEKNVVLYQNLSDLYMKRRDYKKARETLKYLIGILSEPPRDLDREKKIFHEHLLTSCYADLSEVENQLQHYREALRNIRQAVRREPLNPRFLDLQLKISIIVKDKKLAEKTLRQLKKVDPENQKIETFQEEIDKLSSE